jgi:hypothetical protein
VNWEMYLEAAIERVWRRTCRPRFSLTHRCTCRLRLSGFGNELRGRDQVELRDALGGQDRADLEMHFEIHLEAEIEELPDAPGGHDRVELREALGGRDGAGLEMHLEAKIE